MILCKDCKHYNIYSSYRGNECERKIYFVIDVVKGNKYKFGGKCPSDERTSILPWKCGRKARYFVAKE